MVCANFGFGTLARCRAAATLTPHATADGALLVKLALRSASVHVAAQGLPLFSPLWIEKRKAGALPCFLSGARMHGQKAWYVCRSSARLMDRRRGRDGDFEDIPLFDRRVGPLAHGSVPRRQSAEPARSRQPRSLRQAPQGDLSYLHLRGGLGAHRGLTCLPTREWDRERRADRAIHRRLDLSD